MFLDTWEFAASEEHALINSTPLRYLSKMINYFDFMLVIWWKFLIFFFMLQYLWQKTNILQCPFFPILCSPTTTPSNWHAGHIVQHHTDPTNVFVAENLEQIPGARLQNLLEILSGSVGVFFRQHINVYSFVMRYSTIKYGCYVWLSTCFLPCSVAISLHGALCNLLFPQHSPT